MRMELNLNTLKDFDLGRAAVAWEKAMRQIVCDCIDRPGDTRTREVGLTTKVTPVLIQEGDVVDATVEFTIRAKMPAWQTKPQQTAINKRGQLFFNDMASDNPRQHTIDEAGEEAE